MSKIILNSIVVTKNRKKRKEKKIAAWLYMHSHTAERTNHMFVITSFTSIQFSSTLLSKIRKSRWRCGSWPCYYPVIDSVAPVCGLLSRFRYLARLFVCNLLVVLNFFPTPVQEECLSQDKRRRGICMNTYECRIQGGKSNGRCALGFGVCCICKYLQAITCYSRFTQCANVS